MRLTALLVDPKKISVLKRKIEHTPVHPKTVVYNTAYVTRKNIYIFGK